MTAAVSVQNELLNRIIQLVRRVDLTTLNALLLAPKSVRQNDFQAKIILHVSLSHDWARSVVLL